MFKPQTLLVVLEVFFDADHAGNLGMRKSQFGGMAVMLGALDQACDCSAEHRRTEQWRGILCSVQVVTSCAPEQGNVERLALRSGLRDPHPLRWQICKARVCSTRTGDSSTCLCALLVATKKQKSKDVKVFSIFDK